ncbi:hypothetical protein [Saccharomonospora piscinae]|uniref:hypothetical protein n=1 Tax=Saccharomonospora piscinae TaxID=687388 RepID=UPI0012DE4A2B|nr:hypothetical protein [Saccharomonospora piscinae]
MVETSLATAEHGFWVDARSRRLYPLGLDWPRDEERGWYDAEDSTRQPSPHLDGEQARATAIHIPISTMTK